MTADVTMDPAELALAMAGPKHTERLRINGAYPNTALTRWLFSQIGLLHLVAPYFPGVIRTDFPVYPQTQELITAMYGFEDVAGPIIEAPKFNGQPFPRPRRCAAKRAVVAYSGGKDSMWNLARAQEKYGTGNVLAVHISGLGKGVAAGERKAAIAQARRFDFPLRIVDLRKSSGESGVKVLRSAKIFDSALVLPLALEFGSSRIITEEPGGSHFTGQQESMRYYNRAFLQRSGIPVRVVWWSRPLDGVVKDLIRRRPNWLPHVHNCFSPAHYKIGIRKSWQKRTPTFPPFQNACGSCVKCRLTRLGWLLYGSHRASHRDAIYFIRDTEQWARHKRSTHQDLIGGSLDLYLRRARRRYGLRPRYA